MTRVSAGSVERGWHAGYEAYATEGDMRLLARMLPPAPARILDVPCGFGRLVTHLGESGYDAVGMDISMQAVAATLARPQGRASVADMAALPLASRAFDAVICMGNSIGYLDDEVCEGFFATVRDALRPGGTFVLQCGHRDSYVRADIRPRETVNDEGARQTHLESFDVVSGRRTISERHEEPDGHEYVHETVVRLYTATELDRLLGYGGLRSSDWFGDVDLGPLTTDSAMLVVVATRP